MHRPSYALVSSMGAVAAAVALGACGGSPSPGASAAANERAREKSDETKFADFAKCLREHGINAETATGPGGHGLKISPGGGRLNPAAFEAAQRACARYRPESRFANLSPQQKVELEEDVQKFAKCMREHGIHVQTQVHSGAVRIGIQAHPGGAGPNPESPGFQRAQSACQKLLPKPAGGERGSGPQQLNGGK